MAISVNLVDFVNVSRHSDGSRHRYHRAVEVDGGGRSTRFTTLTDDGDGPLGKAEYRRCCEVSLGIPPFGDKDVCSVPVCAG